ncbi:unnamed protein product (macronuclear) [Paramecium tetraurelia]|uniref:Uncharacterized protein n=1 Tax=Paramecium tetraurelia TaxID=5888 RepID=A0EB23_PARTE|nr:uncharacterized protein GSPATT00025224001 [Paramecium tetraurelia]CAK92490.1 unnamed protein product [Paramecium tetraurelia]|eukprot:XP_001459887.1 hypothetical protein (macronuclear) [Paramecium tetraurelia strain d4-2]
MIRGDSHEFKQNAYSQILVSKSSKEIQDGQSSRRDHLFSKLPSLDCTQPNNFWQIKKGGSARCIVDSERLSTASKPLTPQAQKKQKNQIIQIEENNQFDLGSSRHFQRLFTVKNKVKSSNGSVKTSRDENTSIVSNNVVLKKSQYHQTQLIQQSQQSQSSVQQQQCPFSSGKSINDILSQFKEKKSKTSITRHSEFEKMEGLDDYAKEFAQILAQDEQIGPVIGTAHEMKGVVKALIDLSNGNKLAYHFESLKQLHQDLNITDEMFNRFKYLYIKKLIDMKIGMEVIFKCAQKVEYYRGAIICNSRSVQNVKDSIRTIAKNMYAQIFEDFSLSPLFKGTKQEEQAIKFSRIFGFILGSSESTNYVMDSMRDFHKAFGINSVQYSVFKYYLSGAMSKHAEKEVVYYILEQTDSYKAAVIDQDSIKDLVYKQFGIDNFCAEFIKLCQTDPYINKNFIHKIGYDQFVQHTKYFLHYAFNKQNNCFTLEDLSQLHCQHQINIQLYQSIKDKLFNLLARLNPQRVIFQDFEEEFDIILPYITNKKLPCDIVGETRICEFVPLIADELQSNVEIKNVFDSNDANVQKTILKKFEYLLSGRKYFKRSDIQAIHSRLKISEAVFEEFIYIIEKVIQQYDTSLLWMIDAIKEWKYIIITV